LKGETATQVIALALHWLMDFTAKPQAQFVFNRLLARKDLKGEAATQAMALALQWLADFIDKLDAQFVFHPLLERKDLKGKAAAQAMALALQWLAEFADKPEGGFVLAPLVGRADLKGELATQTVTLALRWTERFGHTEKAGFVLVEWCLSAGTIEIPNRIQELALEWSAKYKSCGGGLPALVLRLCALRPDNPDAKKIVMSALSWVRAHERHPLIGQALVALLQKHAAIDGVVDVTVASGLNAGWNFETGNVRKSLCIALDLLPPSDSRRGEIEALLESVD
jgi:hypothetical protein